MARQQQTPDQPATFAEGGQVPTVVPALSPEAVAAQTPAPTDADYQREHGTYRAKYPLIVNGQPAVPAQGPVPASHPYLRDSDELGPGWVSTGAVELTGDYDPPADLMAAHQAYEQQQAGAFPGSVHPGV